MQVALAAHLLSIPGGQQPAGSGGDIPNPGWAWQVGCWGVRSNPGRARQERILCAFIRSFPTF